MDKFKINDCILILTSELSYLQNKLPNEKDPKIVKLMMNQINLISQTNIKLLNIINNLKGYRENS